MYTQRDEEPVLLRELEGIKNGRLLDVGAFDGRTFSTSLALIERGWGGILLEPSPGPFAKLTAEHAGRSNVRCIRAAATIRRVSHVTMWLTDDGLSTTEKAHRDKWVASGAQFTDASEVPAVHIVDLADDLFDFVSIDTEATSVPLLACFLAALRPHQRPKLLCVEHDDHKLELDRLFEDTQYHIIHITDENTIARRID